MLNRNRGQVKIEACSRWEVGEKEDSVTAVDGLKTLNNKNIYRSSPGSSFIIVNASYPMGYANTSRIGTYTVRYWVTDAKGNTNEGCTCMSPPASQGAFCTLDEEGKILGECKYADCKITGSKGTVDCTFQEEFTDTVTVFDTEPPHIELTDGSTAAHVQCSEDGPLHFGFVEPTKNFEINQTASAIDCYPESPDVSEDWSEVIDFCMSAQPLVTAPIRRDVLQIKSVRYSATDQARNIKTLSRDVYIHDTTKPTITILGKDEVTFEARRYDELGFELEEGLLPRYKDEGASADDLVDGKELSTRRIKVSGLDAITSARAKTYLVNYDVTDRSGNEAKTMFRRVIVKDTTPPTITLQGEGVSPLSSVIPCPPHPTAI